MKVNIKDWFKFLLILVFLIVIFQIFLIEKELSLDIYFENYNSSNLDDQIIIDLGEWENDSLNNLIFESKRHKRISDRIDYISGKFIGTYYEANTLIGDKNLNEKLVINLAGVDCFTFLDYILSFALSSDINDFYRKLRLVRYQLGDINFKKRNHFFSQWIKNNSNYLSDVSQDIEGSICLTKKINQKENGEHLIERINPLNQRICFLPKEVFLENISSLQKGDFIGFYSNREELDVTHVGIISKDNSKVYLRHASQKEKRVIDEELNSYLKNNTKWDGLIIVRPSQHVSL